MQEVGILENDNIRHIPVINHKTVKDSKDYLELEVFEIWERKNKFLLLNLKEEKENLFHQTLLDRKNKRARINLAPLEKNEKK